MASDLDYRKIVKDILLDYAKLKPAYGDIEARVIFGDERGSYAVMQVGWDGPTHVHGSVIHVEVIGDKVWIQYDGTETGIAHDLVDAGIPPEHIVLGFRPEKLRTYTGFAVK